MAELGISLTYSFGNPDGLGNVARQAEEAGFAGAFVPEGGTHNGMLSCYMIARATQRMRMYTWIANIHLRLPMLCAGTAMMIQEAAGGRFVLGLGVSHRPAMEAMGVRVANNREKLRDYATQLRKIFRGEVGGGRGPVVTPSHPIPIYFSALSVETARLAGEMADGLELLMCTPERARRLADAAHESARSHGRNPADVKITVGVPTYLHDDLDKAYEAARQNLAPYVMLPFYQRQWIRSGFEDEAKAAVEAAQRGDQAAQRAAVSNRLIDAVALAGPPSRCLARLAAYHATGADVVVISARPVGEDQASANRRAIGSMAKGH